MDYHSLAQEIRAALPGLALAEEEPMAKHCSFHIGGPAAILAEPESEETLSGLFRLLREKGEQPEVIGCGTNLLVRDEGIRAVVVRIGEGLAAVSADGETLTAGAGVRLSRLAVFARDRCLTGLEFSHGIPGSLGGGVVMNAGAYGGEMRDAIYSVRWMGLDGETHETADLDFGYRRSAFSGGDRIVLGARLRLAFGDPASIGARMEELAERRKNSQPLTLPSAGSTFKRPTRGYAAALIDMAGLKGLRVGGAMVSEKHAGFVVNAGGATCRDVLELMERIRAAVLEKCGVELEPEVRLLG